MDIYTRMIPTQKPYDFIFDHRKIKPKNALTFRNMNIIVLLRKKERKTYKYENIFHRNTQGLL